MKSISISLLIGMLSTRVFAVDCPDLSGLFALTQQINSDGTSRDLNGQRIRIEQRGCAAMKITATAPDRSGWVQSFTPDGTPAVVIQTSDASTFSIYAAYVFVGQTMQGTYESPQGGQFVPLNITTLYELDTSKNLKIVETDSQTGEEKTRTTSSVRQ